MVFLIYPWLDIRVLEINILPCFRNRSMELNVPGSKTHMHCLNTRKCWIEILIKLQIGSGSIVQKLQKGIWAAASTFLVIHPTTTIHNYSLLFYSSLLCYEMPYFQRGKFWFLVLPIHAIIILPHTASGPFGPLFIEKIWVEKPGAIQITLQIVNQLFFLLFQIDIHFLANILEIQYLPNN